MISLSAINFQNKFKKSSEWFKPYLNSVIKSCSQLFFSDKVYIGYLFLLFVGFQSYYALACILLGAITGNVTSYLFFRQDHALRAVGGVGYTCCIVGLYLTAFVTHHPLLGIGTIMAVCVFTIFINHYSKVYLYQFGTPNLSLAPILALWIAYSLYSYFAHIDIRSYYSIFFHPYYYLLFYVGYLFFYTLSNYKVGLVVILITLPIFIFSFLSHINMSYFILNIAIAMFAPAAYFIPRHQKGWWASLVAVLLCLPLFYLGEVLYQYFGLPILVMPSILAIWITFYFIIGPSYYLPVSSVVLHVAKLLQTAQQQGKKVVCISGAGVSTASGIPDYASGKWTDKDIPQQYYTFPFFLNSRVARKMYFDSCSKFKKLLRHAKPSIVHKILARLQKKGIVKTIITQNVDGLLQLAGATSIIELHGNMSHLHCLRCGTKARWPVNQSWQETDLLCQECQGFLKPAVKAYQESLDIHVWEEAIAALTGVGVLLVLGSRLTVESTAYLVQWARQQHAQIIFINDTELPNITLPNDIFVCGKLEQILPVLWLYST